MKKKLFLLIFLILSAILFGGVQVHAAGEEGASSLDEYYQEQMETSGANDLWDELPGDTQNSLENLGVTSPDWQSIQNLSPGAVFSEIGSQARTQAKGPLAAMFQVLFVILLCALMEGLKVSFGDRPLSGVVNTVGTLCVCAAIIMPIVSCIAETAEVIYGSSMFLMCYVPVLAGIMIAGGQTVSAASYHMMMIGAGEVVSQLSTYFLVPMLNIFLALSIVSSISPRLKFNGICEMFYKAVKWVLSIVTVSYTHLTLPTKWVLSIVMTIFVSLLTIQNLIGVAADNAGTKAVKFAVSNFIPVVGGALSDAYTTVQSCVKVLKSGVGAFGILAAGVIFLPVLLELILWLAAVNLSAVVGDLFELKEISVLLRSVGKVISAMIAIVVCCMVILIISTVLLLLIGGGHT